MVLNRRRQYLDSANAQGGENESLLHDRSKYSNHISNEGNTIPTSPSNNPLASRTSVSIEPVTEFSIAQNQAYRNPMVREIELPYQSQLSSFSSYRHGENSHTQYCSKSHLRSTRTAVTVELEKVQSPTPEEFVYYTVRPGDTLQNLSVKYSCPVASIKRLNNLWSDQEFYGRSKIKLPVGKLHLIADAIHRDQTKGEIGLTSPNHHDSTPQPSSSSLLSSVEPNYEFSDFNDSYKSEAVSSLGSTGYSGFVFRDLDLNIARAKTAAHSYKNNANAIFQSLADSGNMVCDDEELDDNKIAQREAEILLNDMSDYGLSYSGLILFIFIVCLICPLAYIIYLEETHHDRIRHSD